MTSPLPGLDVLPYRLVADDGDAGHAARQRARAVTRLGTVGGVAHAFVDPAGLVTPSTGGASIDWWVGAEDKWHVPSCSASVRQGLLGASPVVETRMRVPGGDIVHRCYAIQDAGPDGGRTLAVIQVENASAVPVAVALAVRPYDLARTATVASVEVDGTMVTADGVPVLVLPKPPQAIAVAAGADGDVAAEVFAGTAGPGSRAHIDCPDGLAQAALVYPLTHTASITVVVPLGVDGAAPSLGMPAALPDADAVARGWATQSDRGMRLVLPDDRLQQAVDANRRYLLSMVGDPGAVHGSGRADDGPARLRAAVTLSGALDRYGFHDEAGEVLSAFVDHAAPRRMDSATAGAHGALLSAFARHHDVHRSANELARRAVPSLARTMQLIYDASRPGRLRRRRSAVPVAGADRAAVLAGLRDGARLLWALDEEAAARSAERFAEVLSTPASGDADHGRDDVVDRAAELDGLLASASATWTWSENGIAGGDDDPSTLGHSSGVAARFLTLVRDLLVCDADDGVVLLRHVPRPWYGRNLEVHDAPTRAGTMSYAVRWHGERPALLWEYTPNDAQRGDVSITCPGLDPAWATTAPSGEALLAAPVGVT